jgi:type III secretion system YopN/LcrE/InvE/MxiC family regulator
VSGPSIEIARQSVAAYNVVSPVGAPIVAERQGAYRGETVRPTTENTQISTAAGTRGLSVQSALQSNLATLAQRVIAQGQATDPEATARTAALRDKLPDIPGSRQLSRLISDFDTVQQQLAAPAAEEEIAAEIGSEVLERSEAEPEEVGRETKPEEEGTAEQPTGTLDTSALARALQARQSAREDGSGEGGGNEEALQELFRALERFDSDPTHQFAALDNLRSHFMNASAEFQLLLDQAMAVFEQNADLAQAVRAGYAAAEIAHRAGATLGTDPRKVRDAYRAMLREQPNLGTLFDALVEKFGLTGKFEDLVETFLMAAGRDLASTGPSTDELFLHALTTELGKLKKMRSVFEDGKELIRLTDRIAPASERGRLEPVKLTSRILNFCGKRNTVTVADARGLLVSLEGASPQHRLVFFNGLINLHAQIPSDIMASTQALLQQKTVLATIRNQLVEAEELSYESGPAA